MKVGRLGGLDGGSMWSRYPTSFQWQTKVANPDPVNPPLPLGLNNVFNCSLVESVTLSHTFLKLLGIILFEGVTLLDPTVVTEHSGTAYTKNLTETVTLTDPTVTTEKTSGGTPYTKELTETAVLVDTLRAVAQTKQLTEVVGLADTDPFSSQGVEVGAPVIWTSLFRTTASGTSVTNVNGANSWGPIAVGRQTLASGDGWVEWLDEDGSAYATVGFYPAIPPRLGQKTVGLGWSWYRALGSYYCEVGGVNAAGPFTAAAGDRLRVAIESGVVKFYRNSVLIHTAGAASYPMYVWTHIYTSGYTTNATINGPFKPNNEIAYEPLGPLADTVTKQAGKVLTENLTLTDPTVVTEKTGGGATNYTKDLTESATLTDTARASKGTQQLTETATLADTPTKAVTKTIVGIGASQASRLILVDTVRKGEGRAVAEVVSLADTVLRRKGTQQLSDVATLTDTVRPQKATQQLSELVSLTDLTVETQKVSGGGTAYTKDLTETAALTDTLRAQKAAQQLAEGVTLADTVRPRAGTKQASELVTLTATPTKAIGKTRTETATLTATPTKGAGKQVSELVTLLDTLRARAGTKQASETVVLTDAPTKATARTLTESLTLTDPTVTTVKGLAATSYSVTLTENAVLSVGYLHVTALVITEDLGLSDELTAIRLNPRPPITVTGSLHLTDVVEARVVARVLPKSQTIRLTDTITTVRTRKEANPTEVVSLTATLTVSRSATDRILTETILLRDAVSAPDMYAEQEVLEFAG